MELNSSAVETKTFDVVKRNGADPDQVRAYLRSLANGIEQLQARVATAERRAFDLETELREAHNKARSAADTVVVAAEVKQHLLGEAELRAEEILRSAYEQVSPLDPTAIALRVAAEASDLTSAVFAGLAGADAAGLAGHEAEAVVAAARADARRIKADARAILAEAEELALELRKRQEENPETVSAAYAESTRILAEAREQAARVVSQARLDADQLLVDAELEASAMLAGGGDSPSSGGAGADVESFGAVTAAAAARSAAETARLRREANQAVESARAEAAAIVARADDAAADLVAVARLEADEILDDAKRTASAEAAVLASGAEAAALRDQAQDILDAASAKAEVLGEEARAVLADARAEAASVVARADQEAAAMRAKASEELERAQHVAAIEEESDVVASRRVVADMVREAESLVEEARREAESILAEARLSAAEVDDPNVEVRRAIAALWSVAGLRVDEAVETRRREIGAARADAAELMAAVRRDEALSGRAGRAALIDDLHRLQQVVETIEQRLLGSDETGGTSLVLDLRDRNGGLLNGLLGSGSSDRSRPSRYQVRSANLPSLGDRLERVKDSMAELRRHMPDLK